jgi:exopolysaccharide production protein ExoQ
VLTLLVGDPTFSARTDIWKFVIEAIGSRPLFGYGYGSYWDVGVEGDPLRRLSAGSWLGQVELGVINQAHNGYLDLAVQIGVPAAIFATLAVAIWFAFSIRSAADPQQVRSFGRGLLLFQCFVLLQFILHNMMEASLYSRVIGLGNFMFLVVFMVARLRLDAPLETAEAGPEGSLRPA